MSNEHTQEKHTPLPWEKSPKYSPNQDEYIEIIKGGVIIARIYNSNFQQGIKRGEGEANAEYIVKCVTAYPSLVEAIIKITEYRELLSNCLKQPISLIGNVDYQKGYRQCLQDEINMLDNMGIVAALKHTEA